VLWIEPTIQVDSSIVQRDLTLAGLGVSLLLSFVVEREIRARTLVPLFEAPSAEVRTIQAVYPTPRHASAKVRAFVRALQAEFKDATWSHA
jgi:DNA-binding transcriptional LysR family regulator